MKVQFFPIHYLCWVPSHVGNDNEKARLAKIALDLPHVKVGVPNTDLKHHISQYILFPLCKMIGKVLLQTSVIVSSRT